ncbi:MAG: hypothetical protein AUK47_01090 [Deltaproteobacteria bacterium CG2_30_63_29]|nr:MAG: hypothetical protein AUK47_01090 [Deltaproteobacteria bacterium CG2_30_63_29]
MDMFLETIILFPTVIFTVLFIIVLLYWLFVVFGAFDIDLFGGSDGLVEGGAEAGAEGLAEGAAHGIAEGAAQGIAEGAAQGIAEGAAHGIAEGAAHGIAEGAANGIAEGAAHGLTEGVAEGAADGLGDGLSEGVAHGATEGGAHAAGHGAFTGLLTALKLRSAPVTVVFSLIVLCGWVTSYVGTRVLQGSPALPTWLSGLLILLVALLVGVVVTSIVIRPLAPIFRTHPAAKPTDLIGKTCIVRTGRVDAKFGQARFENGGSSLIIDVRCEEANRLSAGKVALIIDFDEEREFYWVEPLEPMLRLPSEISQPSDDDDENLV